MHMKSQKANITVMSQLPIQTLMSEANVSFSHMKLMEHFLNVAHQYNRVLSKEDENLDHKSY